VEAREQLRRALDYYERSGVEHLGARAREELSVSGARLRDVAALSGAEALTPAESRIARLAAEGLSNKEIAQHLFARWAPSRRRSFTCTASWPSADERRSPAPWATKTYGGHSRDAHPPRMTMTRSTRPEEPDAQDTAHTHPRRRRRGRRHRPGACRAMDLRP
jgi:hypothetical protein